MDLLQNEVVLFDKNLAVSKYVIGSCRNSRIVRLRTRLNMVRLWANSYTPSYFL